MKNAEILIVEDEQHLADGLRFNLEAEGYLVECVSDGEAALELLLAEESHRFDAIILDVMLPGMDGFEVASNLRQAGKFIPVLMLTARGRPEDVLRGFESGADDYLPKPFELKILLARLSGLLRRREWLRTDDTNQRTAQVQVADTNAPLTGADDTEKPARLDKTDAVAVNDVFVFDGKTIDYDALELRVGERRVVRLTLMEAELLRYLIRHTGRAVSRKAMLEDVWNLHEDTDTRAIDNFIVRLRRYIEDEPSKPRHLLTVRGVGYRFIASPVDESKKSNDE